MSDVARRAGVSNGTADRALNDKPGVNAGTRARVLEAAATLGYRPNLAARLLGTGRLFRVSVQVPEAPTFFWRTLGDGLREAAASFAPFLGLELGATGHPATADARLTGLERDTLERDGLEPQGDVPFAFLGDDVPATALFSVSADGFSVGSQAAELLGRFVSRPGQVAIVTGSASTRPQAEQLRGFVSSLPTFSAHLELAAVVESHGDERETHRRICDTLRDHPRLTGVFVGAGDSMPTLQAARQAGRLGGLTIVTTDISREVFSRIHGGDIAATIYQRPLEQGHAAIRLLYEYLQTRALPARRRQVIAPYAVTRSNLPIVLEQLEIARAAAVADEAAHELHAARQTKALPRLTPARSIRPSTPGSLGSRLEGPEWR